MLCISAAIPSNAEITLDESKVVICRHKSPSTSVIARTIKRRKAVSSERHEISEALLSACTAAVLDVASAAVGLVVMDVIDQDDGGDALRGGRVQSAALLHI